MSSPGYSAEVARLFWECPGAGAPDGSGWFQGEAAEPLTATRVRWFLQVTAGRVTCVRYQVRGCPHTLAVAAHAALRLAGAVAGTPVPDVGALAADLGVPPGKLGRLLTIEDAITAAAGAAGLKLGARTP